jgi:hypothetical protein
MTLQHVAIADQVLAYLRQHHIITLGTASFTGMPHAATIAYASDASGLYFSMPPDQLTVVNIDANHWASFTIDEYTPDAWSAIATQFESLTYEPGQVIVRQGERSDRCFIIVDGEVEVRREGHGVDVVVTRHGPGHLFGEAGALSGMPLSATCTAVVRSVVLAIDRSALRDFFTQSASADLAQRVRETLSTLNR